MEADTDVFRHKGRAIEAFAALSHSIRIIQPVFALEILDAISVWRHDIRHMSKNGGWESSKPAELPHVYLSLV
jgi:hypothetical protein